MITCKRANVVLLLLLALILAGPARAEVIRCASTTSTQNSGLFEYLLPRFEKDTGISVQVIAVGTGAALKLGQNGDVDVVFVHAKEKELEMVAQGWFINRKEVMYNDFVVVGPPADPAMIRDAGSAGAAFRKIMAKGSAFVSRGDNSGTNINLGPGRPDSAECHRRLVSGGRPGDGENHPHRGRERGLYPQRPGDLVCGDRQGRAAAHHPLRKRQNIGEPIQCDDGQP